MDVDIGVLVALVLLAYLVGATSPASIVAWRRGVDLSRSGSGNPGATNVARVMGRGWGLVVGVADVAKGAAPSLLALELVGRPWAYLVGLAAVLGHVTSPFLRGRGGKGVATSLGVLLALAWWWVAVVGLVFVVVLALLRWVAGASVAAAVTLVPVCLLLPPAWGVEGDWWSRGFGLVLVVVILGRHRTNLVLRWVARQPRGGS